MTNDLNNLQTSTWTKLSNPPRTEGHPASIVVLNDGKAVCTFSGRRNSSGAFTASSGVFIYDPMANSWTDVSDNGMHYWTKDVVIDPNDPTQNTWYVGVFSGWGGAPNGLGGLYKTTNRGSSWTKLTASQFDRVTSITFYPNNLNQAYLTTEIQGLWTSLDMNAATPTWTNVASYPFRQPERVFFNPYQNNMIWVTSFGSGIKSGDMSEVIGIDENSTALKNAIEIFPNPVSGSFKLKFISPHSENSTIEICNTIGQTIFTKQIKSIAGENNISLSVDGIAKGIYFVLVKNQNEIKSGKIIVE